MYILIYRIETNGTRNEERGTKEPTERGTKEPTERRKGTEPQQEPTGTNRNHNRNQNAKKTAKEI